MLLSKALRVQPKDVIAFVGGGGKTTAMFRLADELVAQNKRVVTTTTTRLFVSQTLLAPHHLLFSPSGVGAEADLIERVRAFFATGGNRHLLITGPEGDDGKSQGVPPTLIDHLIALDEVDNIINEADGARGLSLKSPASHEPVLSHSTTLLVPVVGVTAVGAPLDSDHVHRPELVARLAGARQGETVTSTLAARVLAHPEGGLKGKPDAARAVVLVNQVETDEQYKSARTLAHLLLAHDQIAAVAIGAVGRPEEPIRETHRRLAVVVLGAGAGTRMQGRIKQLLPWRNKTLIENAIEIAVHSSASEAFVVLGAHAEEIRPLTRDWPIHILQNEDWAEGQSSSLRCALTALPASTDAVIFMNIDQPLLTSGIVDAVIQRYRETDAPIVASRFAGQRGSPVLFNRANWPELVALQGEQGGRFVLGRHSEQVAWVDFPDAQPGIDVDTYEEYERLVRERN